MKIKINLFIRICSLVNMNYDTMLFMPEPLLSNLLLLTWFIQLACRNLKIYPSQNDYVLRDEFWWWIFQWFWCHVNSNTFPKSNLILQIMYEKVHTCKPNSDKLLLREYSEFPCAGSPWCCLQNQWLHAQGGKEQFTLKCWSKVRLQTKAFCLHRKTWLTIQINMNILTGI